MIYWFTVIRNGPIIPAAARKLSRGLRRESAMGLTVKRVERLTAPGRYGDGHGLYLQVLSATNRSWVFRYERAGRERMLGLGPAHTINLQEARERARKARQLLLDGTDPLDARAEDRALRALEAARTITFENASQAFYEAHEGGWKNAHL